MNGREGVKARLVAKGKQGAELQGGSVGATGCVTVRSSHLKAVSLGGSKERSIWSLDIKNWFLQSDGFCRDVFLRVLAWWDLEGARRVRKLHAPAHGLTDAPAACRAGPGTPFVEFRGLVGPGGSEVSGLVL